MRFPAKSTKTKKKSQRQHTQRRASQRYGFTIGPKIYDELCHKIKNDSKDECVFLEKQSNRVSMWAVKVEGQWVPVIYDKERHSIATFLPIEALQPYQNKLNVHQ